MLPVIQVQGDEGDQHQQQHQQQHQHVTVTSSLKPKIQFEPESATKGSPSRYITFEAF